MQKTEMSDTGMRRDVRAHSVVRQNKELDLGLWILQVFLGLVFIAVGGSKLFDTAPAVEMFKKIGVGQMLRYLIGTIEVFGAITLWNPRYSSLGALLLAITMSGVIFMHLFVIGGSPIVSFVLLILLSIVIWGRRDEIKQIFNIK